MSTRWCWWSSLNADCLTPVWKCLWGGMEVGGAKGNLTPPPHCGSTAATFSACCPGVPGAEWWMDGEADAADSAERSNSPRKKNPKQNIIALERIQVERILSGRNNAVYSLPVEAPWGRVTSLNRSTQVLGAFWSPETRNDLQAVILRCARTSPESQRAAGQRRPVFSAQCASIRKEMF